MNGRLAVCGVALALAASVSAGFGAGIAAGTGENLDQSNVPPTDASFSCPGTGATAAPLYQSFTPHYRQLAAVDLFLRPGGDFAGVGTPLVVAVWTWGYDGHPGSILREATGSTAGTDLGGGSVVLHARFSPPLVLDPQRWFVIQGPPVSGRIVSWMGSRGNTYSGGSLLSCVGVELKDRDASFRTYVPDDATPPDTQLTRLTPSRVVSSKRSAGFSLAGTDDLSYASSLRFHCSLDGARYASCTSPLGVNALVDGRHALRVVAEDEAGKHDATPASSVWTVDTKRPSAPLIIGPATVRGPTAVYRLRSRDALTPTARLLFRCSVDSPRLHPCTSPYTARLRPGRHLLRAAATDEAGNSSSVTVLPVEALPRGAEGGSQVFLAPPGD